MITSLTATPVDAASAAVAYVPPPTWIASAAASSATQAAASAASVASEATAAAGSASAAAGSATAASGSATAAATSATSAGNAASAAAGSATAAGTSAANAGNSASAAAGSASAGATSATNAINAASASAGSAAAASTSATNAATSATSAAASQAAAAASLRSLNVIWLGAQANDPTTDNNGNALVSGAEYFNTTSSTTRVYSTSAGWANLDAAAAQDQSNAAMSASAAAGSASNAASSASAASGSASAASTSATSAGNSATAAANSAASITSRTIATGAGLVGGGTLSGNLTLSFDTTWGDGRYGTLSSAQTFTGAKTFSNAIVRGGSIDGTVIGGATPAPAAFSTLTATGVASLSTLTATEIATFNCNTQSVPAPSGGVSITWNYSNGAAETVFWNDYPGAVDSFEFCQVTGPGTFTRLFSLTPSQAIVRVPLTLTTGLTNANLAQMPTLTIKSNIAGAAASPTDSTMSAILDAVFGTTQGNVLARGSSGWTSQAPSVAAAQPRSAVRQTVQSGPASSGAPAFLPATSSNLTLTAQGIGSSAPLVVTAAQGFNVTGQADVTASLTSSPSWTLTASATNYLLLNASSGATSTTTLQPIYQFGGAISAASGQFTFDYQAMVGYVGNGSAAVATPLVCVGEAVAGASSITSTIAYAFNGFFDSAWVTTVPALNTATNFNSYIGCNENTPELIAEVVTAANGYAVGDRLTIYNYSSADTCYHPVNTSSNRLSATWTTGDVSPFYYQGKGSNAKASATAGSTTTYRIKMRVTRNF